MKKILKKICGRLVSSVDASEKEERELIERNVHERGEGE